jgi:hypothetical protein
MNSTTVSLFSSTTLVLGLLAPRMNEIYGHGSIRKWLERLIIAQALIWVVFLLRRDQWRHLAWLVAICTAVLLHSWSFLYQPNLRFGVPVYDYLVGNNVSSGHCWMFAKIYTARFAFIALGVMFWSDVLKRGSDVSRRAPMVAVVVVFLAQFVVAHLQAHGYWASSWNGSGSSLGASRVPGLFEDSGAFSVNMGIAFAGLLAYGSQLKKTSWKILAVLVVCGALWSLKPVSGRLMMQLPILGVVTALLIQGFQLKSSKMMRPTVLLGLCFLIYGLLWFYGHLAAQPEREYLFLDYYLYLVDSVRGVNWKASMIAINAHPFFGSGLGAYFGEYDLYAKQALTDGGYIFYDPPANFYLMILSELGIAGCLLWAWFFLGLGKIWRSQSIVTVAIVAASLWSLMVGVHILFISFVVMAPLALKIRADLAKPPNARMLGAVIFFLLLPVVWRVATAPEPAHFREHERGRLQELP